MSMRVAAPGSVVTMSRRVAVFDLGSSSFHLLVCDVTAAGALEPVSRHRATLDLGVALGASGRLPHDRLIVAARALRRLRDQLQPLQPEVVVALGTAALRDAANRDEVVDTLSGAADTTIRVLDGPEEARLCFVGQAAAVWTPATEPVAGIDLGGGSLEMAIGCRGSVLACTSVPVGATRLRGELGDSERLDGDARRVVADRVAEAVTDWPATFAATGATTDRVLASGGTVRALARVATAHARRPELAARASVNQVELTARQLAELATALGDATLAERQSVLGMPARRAPSIALGAAVLAAVAAELHVGRLVVSEWGLREGAILDAVSA